MNLKRMRVAGAAPSNIAMIKPRSKGRMETHAAALLFGGTALFSKWIELPAIHITLWRSVAAVMALIAVQRMLGKSLSLDRRSDYFVQLGLGMLLGMHWWTYFASMQISTVAIGLISLFTAPVITVLLEPLVAGTRLRATDILLGMGALVGVCLLVPALSWEDAYLRGVVYGLTSALFLSVRNVLHRQVQREYRGLHLMIYQVLGVIPLFAVLSLLQPAPIHLGAVGQLALLGIVFTALPHTLIAMALRHLAARSVILITSLMLVYGALLAWMLLGETPAPRTLLGGAVIAGCAIIENRRAHMAPVSFPPSSPSP